MCTYILAYVDKCRPTAIGESSIGKNLETPFGHYWTMYRICVNPCKCMNDAQKLDMHSPSYESWIS